MVESTATRRQGPRTGVAVLAMVTVLVVALLGTYLITRVSQGEDRHRSSISVGDVTATGMRIRVNGLRSSGITPLRAGDLITLRADVTTSGAGSLWMRTFLDVSGTDPALAPYLSIYDGPIPNGASLHAATDITDPITFPGYVGTADRLTLFNVQPFVLDGTQESEAAGIDTFPVAVAVYVDPGTPADLLDNAFALTAVVQSLPYRSHPEVPDGDQWVDGPHLPLG